MIYILFHKGGNNKKVVWFQIPNLLDWARAVGFGWDESSSLHPYLEWQSRFNYLKKKLMCFDSMKTIYFQK